MAVTEVVIPYAPRPLQLELHKGQDAFRFGASVCHRRFGKTVEVINQLQKRTLILSRERPRFAYIAPTYTQGKTIAWDYLQHFSQPIPGVVVNHSELRVDYPNGGQIRIFGADNPDSLRGIYLDGVVLDEYGLMPRKIFSEVIRPLLADREGWAFFIGTPNGKNQFYDIVQHAKANPKTWFFAEYKASETGIIPAEELAAARENMTQDEYDQEFECSFEASVRGAVFSKELLAAREQGRIGDVPYDPELRVDTDWDLGFGDATAIWFSQSHPGGRVNLIDYYEANGQGLPHYINVLERKGYVYGEHWAPHDIQSSMPMTKGSTWPLHSRWATARSLGLNFQIVPRTARLEDGIHAARMLLPRCRFDSKNCAKGLEALHGYRWKQNTAKDPTGKELPVHDWASHGADAFRGLAERHYNPKRNPERENAREVKASQVDKGETFFHRNQQRQSGGRGGNY